MLIDFGAGTFEQQHETTVFEEQDDRLQLKNRMIQLQLKNRMIQTTTEEQDDTQMIQATKPILEQIRNRVNETLSASGITGP